MNQKPVILLCWGYNRTGWIYVFEKLRDHFEFVYLYYRDKNEEQQPATDAKKIYWNDFESGFDIIDKIKPEKVIFMSITSGYTLSLNCSAKKRDVPTVILQHGLFRSYHEYRLLEMQDKKKSKTPEEPTGVAAAGGGGAATLKFLLRSFSFSDKLALPRVLLYFYLQRKKGMYYAGRKVFFRQRLATRYICYTPRNAVIHKEIDRIGDDIIDYVGIPELDPFFNEERSVSTSEGYHLLIDQPFADNQYFNLEVSREKANEVYEKLASWCMANNSRLVVKLHPENYKSSWLVTHPAITYERHADTVSLIKNATAVFGTTSTLMLPAIYLKPVFLLLIHDSLFQQRVMELGLAKGSDFFSFTPDQISFIEEKEERALEEFEQEFLYKTDGNSTERVKAAIRDLTVKNS